MNIKKNYGQFFTIANPFHNQLFLKWYNSIPSSKKRMVLEPFAGTNNIVEMINSFYPHTQWKCFDIEPNNEFNKVQEFTVHKKDTLDDFPVGYEVVITNPPYLAKNSATRSGLSYAGANYDDVYKQALHIMLENVEYVAAIIPESFITQNLFHERLYGVASLNCRMFEDTECPVCLALFVPEKADLDINSNDFYIYKNNIECGTYMSLYEHLVSLENCNTHNWKFNDPNGKIGLYAIDSQKEKSISFIDGNKIDKCKIKSTSRGVTRISIDVDHVDIKKILLISNKILEKYRISTFDIFMTSFRGLRKDGDYRRRLDFKTARSILNMAMHSMNGDTYA